MYGCDKDCLKAQMDKYYDDAHNCSGSLDNAQVVAHTGAPYGTPRVKDTGGKGKD